MLDGDAEFEGIVPDFIHMVDRAVCLFVYILTSEIHLRSSSMPARRRLG